MNPTLRSRPAAVFLLISSIAAAQQFRHGQSGDKDLSKRAVERHFYSKQLRSQPDPTKPLPGKYLLDRGKARAQALLTRVHQTGSVPFYGRALSSSVLPGLELRPYLPSGSIANSVITGDFNRDGHMDFIVANGGTDDLWIYFGNGDGTFSLPRIIPLTKGLTPVYLATADLRGTGVLDLIVAEFDTDSIGVLLGNGDGTFGFEQIYTLPEPPSALVVTDFNRDGKLDIAAAMVTVNTPSGMSVPYIATLLGDGTGSFAAPMISMNPGFYSSAANIAAGDVNNDGLPDVIIIDPGNGGSQVYLNAGNGRFTPGPALAGNGPFNAVNDSKLADLNGDGCLDAAVADLNGDIWIFLGDCTGHFANPTPVPMGDSNAALQVIDLNGDGHLDLVTVTIPAVDPTYGYVAGNMLCVAFGDGHGNFTSGRDYMGTGLSYSLSVADFNGDGKPDIVSVSPDTDTATVYLNDGSGGFGFPQGLWIGLPGVGVLNAPISGPSFVDVNRDGTLDMVLLDEGYNGEYFITTMLNDGTGRFAVPIPSDAGISILGNWMGDYRLADFRNTGQPDFLGIGLNTSYSGGNSYILFAAGNGDGTFGKSTLVTTQGADGAMAVGDFNGDGKLDFVAVGPGPTGTGKVLTVFLGNGDGTFRNAGAFPFSDTAPDISRVFAGDFNHDGKLDVLIYDTGNGYWTTSSYVWEFLGNGNGTFQPAQQLFSAFQPMTLADVNGDSLPDIVRYDFFWPDGTTTTWGPAKFTTYLGQLSGGFTQTSSYAPYAGTPLTLPPYLQFGDPTVSALVADLNGDGKLDEIALQRVSPSNWDMYAQILMGNGDGTFTPTYDVFDFNKTEGFPSFAKVLDASGFSDLIEVDGATSSVHVIKAGPAPALQLALQPGQVNGNSGCGWVFLNIAFNTATTVLLSSTVPGVLVPSTVSVPAGALSQQFCYSLSTGYDWHQVIDIRAQLGGDVEVAYASQAYVVGFSETVSPSSDQVVYPGQSTAPVTVTLTSSQGYSSTVQLSCQGLPAGASCVFGASTLSVSPSTPATTTVVIHTSSKSQGGGPVTIVASDANVVKRQAFNLTIQPLIVISSGAAPQTTSPGTATTSVLIVGIPPYVPGCSGLPTGISCIFSGAQLPYPSSTELNLAINVPSGIAAGSYPFVVKVASGPVSATAAFTLSVTDFAIQAPPAATDWAPPGGAMNVVLGVLPIAGFNGTLNVTCSLDFAASCSGGPWPVGGTSVNPASVAVSVPAGAVSGLHNLTITATDGALSHTASFPFYVADYSGSLSQSSLKMASGGNASLTATVNVTAGFAGTLSFACSGTSALACGFTPTTVQPLAGTPQTVTVSVLSALSHSRPAWARGVNAGFLALNVLFPIGLLMTRSGRRRVWLRVVSILAFVTVAITCSSCGGGQSSSMTGSGSSQTYAVTVETSASGTNTTRTLGTLNVTVTF